MKKNLMLFGMICMAAVFAGCSGAETTETEKNAETGNSGAKKEAAVKEGETEEYSVEALKKASDFYKLFWKQKYVEYTDDGNPTVWKVMKDYQS